MLLTPSFFSENWSFLSSAVAVLCTTFFFLRAVPCSGWQAAFTLTNSFHNYSHKWTLRQSGHHREELLTFPPMRTCACSLASFSWFIIVSFIYKKRKCELIFSQTEDVHYDRVKHFVNADPITTMRLVRLGTSLPGHLLPERVGRPHMQLTTWVSTDHFR